MSSAAGGFAWGLAAGVVPTFFLFVYVHSYSDETAVENGIVKLDGQYYAITPLLTDAPNSPMIK